MMEAPLTSPSFRYRRIVVGLLFSVTAINYLDRQTLSVIAPLLEKHLSFSTIGYSRVVFVFMLGYTIGQTLDGKLIDRFGSRRGLLCCVALWSAVSMLHSLVAGVISLGILRFFLGLAEAGNWPGGTKAVGETIPPEQRAFALGVFNSGSTAGAIIAPPLVVAIVGLWGRRPMFLVIGVTGVAWVLLWDKLYRKEPTPAPAIDLHQFPTRALLRDKAVWGLMIGRFFSDPTWWFYAFWLPEYLVQSRGFSLAEVGRTAWIPFAFAGAGGWLGGLASDGLVRKGFAPVKARKIVMVIGAALMLCGVSAFLVRNHDLALALISVVVFGFTGWATNILGLTADIFPGEVVAQVTGLHGTSAAIGGMVFTLATGWLVQNVSYGSVFIVSSGMTICAAGAILWLVADTRGAEARSRYGEK
ncbi:MAG: MFS transporter [Terriglobia bacterium]